MQPGPPLTATRLFRDMGFIDELLGSFAAALGAELTTYRNHVCRVVSLCELLAPLSDVDRKQIQIAACFHDLGIWTHRTFDYLAPSRRLAVDYLEQHGRAEWGQQVERIIYDHHKLRSTQDRLAECFRRADWIDVTRGARRFGVPRASIRELYARYPSAGFHRLLVKLTLRQMLRRPWNPLPMLRA